MKFEKVSRFAAADFNLPVRKTKGAAGYDFEVAEDVIVPPAADLVEKMVPGYYELSDAFTLEEMAHKTKAYNAKPTLVSTGVKCQLDPGYYLELSVRSSTSLKYWLIMANGVGIIDADYYNSTESEGEIFFQLINLSPFPIQLRKGDIIGQGIIKKYYTVNEDDASGERLGGFGSTTQLQLNSIDMYNALNNSKLQTFKLDEPTYIEYNCSLPEETIDRFNDVGFNSATIQGAEYATLDKNAGDIILSKKQSDALASASIQFGITTDEMIEALKGLAKAFKQMGGNAL